MNILGIPLLREGGILAAQREKSTCAVLREEALAEQGVAMRRTTRVVLCAHGKLGQRGVLQVC